MVPRQRRVQALLPLTMVDFLAIRLLGQREGYLRVMACQSLAYQLSLRVSAAKSHGTLDRGSGRSLIWSCVMPPSRNPWILSRPLALSTEI